MYVAWGAFGDVGANVRLDRIAGGFGVDSRCKRH